MVSNPATFVSSLRNELSYEDFSFYFACAFLPSLYFYNATDLPLISYATVILTCTYKFRP